MSQRVATSQSHVDAPAYSLAEAGRLTGLHPNRVRRWLSGCRPRGARRGHYASFVDLIELLLIRGSPDRDVSQRRTDHALDGTIEFDAETGRARRWYPPGRGRHVVIDPYVSFGRPHVAGSRITTANVYDFYRAEHRSLERTCAWFLLEPAQVRAAVRFEEWIAS